MKLVSDRIRQVVDDFFEVYEEVVVGVSGGADSMTLLHCLLKSKKKLNLIVAHLNHNLRGVESDCDENFVREYCLNNGLKFVCRSLPILDIAKAQKISIELAGRNERYKFFSEFGKTIATAHTLSDKIETFFLNLVRGASLKGLCSIPSIRGKIKRPLINFTRFEIENYCIENSISYRNDSSNLSLIYFRNRVRSKIVPEFKKLNYKFESTMLKMFESLEENEAYFAEIISGFLKENLICGKLKLNNFYFQSILIKKRIISEFLKLSGVQVTNLMVKRILVAISIDKNFVKVSLPGCRVAICDRNFLSIDCENKINKEVFDYILPDLNETFCCNLQFKVIKAAKLEYFLKKSSKLFLFKFDYDKIKGLIHVRSRMPGDRIKLPKRPTKTLKKLVQESKLTKLLRNNLVVLADDLGPFYVVGFGGDVRVMPSEDTENLMLIFEKTM